MNNIHKIIRISFLVFFALSFQACNEFLDINTSPNAPENPGDLDLLMADMTATTSYNLVGGGNWTRLGAQWIQHIANNATPPSNDTYRINTSTANNEWAFYSYAGVLINAKRTIEFGEELEQWHHAGIAKILMAHNYALLSDFWSDIPYTQALQREENIKPTFDTQETVYAGVQQLLDDGIDYMSRNADITVGGGDFYYGGDPAAWTRLAYALKARYHLRLTNAPGKDAKQQATLALDALANAMTSPADEARFDYSTDPGSEAPWNQWITKFANTMQISHFMVELLKAKDDPRLPIMADQNNTGEYIGHTNGGMPTPTLGQISSVGQYYLAADFDVPLMTYVEQKFIEAEAYWILDKPADAEAAYNDAIRRHMEELSGNGEFNTVIDAAAIDAYLLANPLTGLEDLIVQKYLAGFVLSSFEAYNDYRRTGYPSALQPAIGGDFNQIPTRMIYTDTEINNNPENVPSGIDQTSKVWWDNN